MKIQELKNIAESIENALLEKVANKQIVDYDAKIKMDGSEIEIAYMLNVPIKSIKVNLVVGSKI